MRTSSVAVLLLFGLSGVAGLGYQVAWTRMFSVGLGHELPGLLAVVTAFFVGLAIGAVALDRPVSRSRTPGRWFAGLELVVAAWAIVIAYAAPWLNALAAELMGPAPTPDRQWIVAFAVPAVALLPATVAMGGTLPAVERLAARLAGRGTTVAGLYAANTLGAAVGIVLAATVLVPLLGLRGTVFVLAAIDVACGLAMWLGPAADERERPPVAHSFADPPPRPELAALLLLTGLLGIGFEVAGVRVIGQVLENTVYTYASTVCIYLLGTAIGAALWQRFGPTDRFASPAAFLLGTLAFAVAIGTAAMAATEPIYDGVREGLAGALGRGPSSIAGELVVAALAFGPATVVMGATFSHLVLAARGPSGGIGWAMALNVLGSAVAPPLVGVMLFPSMGGRWTLTLIAIAYVLLMPLVGPDRIRRWHLIGPAMAGAVLVFPLNLLLISPPAGMRFIPGGVREGVMATVGVAEDPQGDRVLKVNDQFNMGGTRFSFGDRRQAHIPMLLHPDPASALFLGVGSGLTAGAATLHGDVEVTAVELVPEIVGFLDAFDPYNRMADIDRIVVADARRFVRADKQTYDVIVADLFHPARDGAGALYTREHFAAIRGHLNEGGLFCQWLPLYQLDAPVVATIVRTFLDVFPDAGGWIGTYNPRTPILGLVGRVGEPPADLPWSLGGVDPATDGPAPPTSWLAGVVERRGEEMAEELVQLALTRPIDLLGCRMLGPEQLRRLAGEGPLNLDDRPRVVYAAPWYTYATSESGLERVEEMLALPGRDALGGDAALAAVPASQRERVQAFRDARDAYLRSRIAMARGDVDAAWDELIASLSASAEFRTAAVVAVGEARQLARGTLAPPDMAALPADPARALGFLDRIIELRPDLTDARRARAQLVRMPRG